MRRVGLGALTALIVTAAMMPGRASSHREAPLIAQDPMADNTDVYAFVDPNGSLTAHFVTPTDLPTPAAFAVTLEPAGGVSSPTGEKYLVGLTGL